MSAAGKVHPDDILVLAHLGERRDYRHMAFTDRQIVSVTRGPVAVQGRQFRYAWITPFAPTGGGVSTRATEFFDALRRGPGELRPVSEWTPEPPTILERIRALPDEAGYRGQTLRGYQLAIQDVLEVIEHELG